MKFSEMPYARPDFSDFQAQADRLLQSFESGESAQAQIAAYEQFEALSNRMGTQLTLAYIRHTINTKDAFYAGEQDFWDEVTPLLEEKTQAFSKAALASPFREELEAHFGSLLFRNLEIAARSFRPELIPLMQEENKLASEYQKLYASAMVEWEGQQIPLPKLGPYQQSPDRAVRKRAFETGAAFFDAHQEELDTLYDQLIQVRTKQAKLLGYDNYLQLCYDRLGRNCYDHRDVAAFRDQIAADIVPVVASVKERQRRRLGLDTLKFYDDALLFPDGNATPEGTAEEILAAGQAMYRDLSPETAEFVDFLFENQLFDVLSRDGKAPGGYCTELPDYQAPFIFSNFNGTAGDVDVLTHEAGHAFAGFRAMRKGYPSSLVSPTIEACEVHSMSMEFLTQDYHKNFFGAATEKYAVGHCEDALIFLPYGCMVDEFQHIMYEQPELTPAQRNETWLKLEKKYRPWIDFDGLPFYSRGAGWQRQLHIYLYPLYYIDYCMAGTMALQFWMAAMKDRADAWRRYLAFVDAGGTKTFVELVQAAGLKLPYAPGAIGEVARAAADWLEKHPL